MSSKGYYKETITRAVLRYLFGGGILSLEDKNGEQQKKVNIFTEELGKELDNILEELCMPDQQEIKEPDKQIIKCEHEWVSIENEESKIKCEKCGKVIDLRG